MEEENRCPLRRAVNKHKETRASNPAMDGSCGWTTDLHWRRNWQSIDQRPRIWPSEGWKFGATRKYSSPDGIERPRWDNSWLRCWRWKSVRYRLETWRRCRRSCPDRRRWSCPVLNIERGNWKWRDRCLMCPWSPPARCHRDGCCGHLERSIKAEVKDVAGVDHGKCYLVGNEAEELDWSSCTRWDVCRRLWWRWEVRSRGKCPKSGSDPPSDWRWWPGDRGRSPLWRSRIRSSPHLRPVSIIWGNDARRWLSCAYQSDGRVGFLPVDGVEEARVIFVGLVDSVWWIDGWLICISDWGRGGEGGGLMWGFLLDGHHSGAGAFDVLDVRGRYVTLFIWKCGCHFPGQFQR